MSAKFNIKFTFSLQSRPFFVLGGDVIEGIIEKGMRVLKANKQFPINSIEYINRKKQTLIGLVIKYDTIQKKSN